MNIGSRLWITSDEISISMLTKPRIQMPVGICFRVEPPLLVCILVAPTGRCPYSFRLAQRESLESIVLAPLTPPFRL
ncbi:hypothetical protein D3C81_1930650 [compost metagenome]